MHKNKLKELRLKENMTQNEIAEIIGMTQRGYQNYESGRRIPPLITAVKLSDLFMCSIKTLFF